MSASQSLSRCSTSNLLIRPTGFCAMYRICLVLLLCLLSSCLGSSSALDCNPCIQRKDFKLKAIVHGTSEDDFWLQVQAAMGQAADDMGLVLDLTLRREYDAEEMAQELTDAAQSGDFQALIVTIPDSTIQAAVTAVISEDSIPVFGFNQGFEVAREIGILGFAAQDELVAGQAAAEEFIRIRTEASSPITRALFVDNKVGDSGMLLRFQGFRETLAEYSQNSTDSTDIQVDLLLVDPENQFQHVTDIQGAFEGCSYDIILLGSVDSLEIAVAADESQGCLERTTLGSFDETVEIIKNIVLGKLAFGVSQQTYLQGAMPVFFAALYATTGKALALPADERVYLAGPTIINKDNVPTDTQQQCSTDAFPVCPNILAPDGSPATCECADRTKIRIGGVLHGVTTDAFWDPVFAASEQAAKDFEVDLDLIRFEPQDTPEEVYQQMTARIKTLCEAGVDGIFLTIPSDAVVPAVQRCQELNVPVVSVNSGGDTSVALGLLNHIGMLEYSAGFGAGERMIAAGMKRGFCTNHEPGNTATIIRCQAFADAIAAHNSKDGSDLVEYGGELPVPLDNQVEYALILEGAIGSDDDWDGQGIIFVGPAQIPSYRATLVEKHPAAVVGTFDVGSEVQNGLESGLLQFGVDQQPYLQGYIPIILLTLEAYTKQSLKNFFIESGPNFVDTPASEDAKVCEANFFEVCPDRPAEEFNFISSGLTVFGYCLFTLLLLGVLICGAWTFYYRKKWVVKISQPLFLYIMLFGMLLSTLSIPFLGVETEYRFLQDDSTGKLTDIPNEEIGLVDASCMLVPWFYGLGFAVTFSAIFAKIQRVKLIYLAGINMQRKKVTIRDVSNIFLVIFGTELSLLVAWQAASPYKWQREVTEEEDDFPVESVGACESKSGSYFLIGIFLFHVICLIYALILSYQTKDINNEYAESSYLFLTVMFMFQVQCLVIPILALVQDTPDVFYFIQAIAVFSQNFTIIALIFGPKIYKTVIGEADPQGSSVPGRANHRTSLSRVQVPRSEMNSSHFAPLDRRLSRISSPGDEALETIESTCFSAPPIPLVEGGTPEGYEKNTPRSQNVSGLSMSSNSRNEHVESVASGDAFRHSTSVWTSASERSGNAGEKPPDGSGAIVRVGDDGSELGLGTLQESAPVPEKVPDEKKKDDGS